MIRVEDRRNIACDIEQACHEGAGCESACARSGISLRTLQRWKADAEHGLIQGDGLLMRCVLRPLMPSPTMNDAR